MIVLSRSAVNVQLACNATKLQADVAEAEAGLAQAWQAGFRVKCNVRIPRRAETVTRRSINRNVTI
jgi:hypothetical protein